MKRPHSGIVRDQTCPKHPEASRPCRTCYDKAEKQRDAQRREEAREIHTRYLQEIHQRGK